MTTDGDVRQVPAEVELYTIDVLDDDSFRVWLRFPDDVFVSIDVMSGTTGYGAILDVLTSALTKTLSHLGGRGVVVVGTALNDDQEEGSA